MKGKIKWEYEWERRMTFFVADAAFIAYATPFNKYTYPLKNVLFTADAHDNTKLYYGREEINCLSEKTLDRFIEKRLTVPWARDCQRHCDALKNYLLSELRTLDVSLLNDNMLCRVFGKFYQAYLELLRHMCVIRILNREIQNQLDRYFLNKFTDRDLAFRISNLLTAPEMLSIDAKEEIDFSEIVRAAKRLSPRRVIPLLEQHLNKYRWLPVGYHDEKEWQFHQLQERFAAVIKVGSDPGKKISNLRSRIKRIAQRKRKVIQQYRIAKTTTVICQQAAFGAYFKDLTRERLNMAHYYARPLFKEVACRLGLTFHEIKMLGAEEISQALIAGKRFHRRIRQRQQGYVLAKVAGKKIERYGMTVNNFITRNFLIDAVGEHLVGIGVSPGRATGLVLNIKKQKSKVYGKGFVLVTTMTTPELVPLMKRAAAVITDEGGITCHAAIVSRELGIPCIVGTKSATKFLKDGQKVLVDAAKGLIQTI